MNDLCSAINCVVLSDDTSTLTLDVTFLPCSNPISVHTLITFKLGEFEVVFLNVTATEDTFTMFLPPASDANVTILVNPTDNGVRYGVS